MCSLIQVGWSENQVVESLFISVGVYPTRALESFLPHVTKRLLVYCRLDGNDVHANVIVTDQRLGSQKEETWDERVHDCLG